MNRESFICIVNARNMMKAWLDHCENTVQIYREEMPLSKHRKPIEDSINITQAVIESLDEILAKKAKYEFRSVEGNEPVRERMKEHLRKHMGISWVNDPATRICLDFICDQLDAQEHTGAQTPVDASQRA